jgi:alanine dehydrogenase
MLILDRHDVERLLTMPVAIAAVEKAFRQLASGQVVMPQRVATAVAPHHGLHLSMPAFVGGDAGNPGALSIKIVTVFGDNPDRYQLPTIQGLLLLHDARTGQLLAMMDAEYLTAMRTGAASGVATQALARPDARTVTLFGAGAQAAPQLAAVCAVRPIEQIFVITRTPATAAAFAARMSAKLGLPVIAATDVQQAVTAADILCTATNSVTPLFPGAWLRPGVHINAVGAYTAQMRELDGTALARSRLFVDRRQAAATEAGDLLLAQAEGAVGQDHVAGELGELLLGRVAGRRTPAEITLFKSVGLAMQDTVTAAEVYRAALAQDLGRDIPWG